uniref:Ig-like domain-containing protein n=1 Tax=Anabas testudineus TaxID=64144 RepID=A0A3Q1HCU3_ANATE
MEFLLVSFPVNQPFDIQCEREHQCCHDLLQDLNECFVTVGKMTGIQYLAFVWTLFIIHTGFAFGDIQFLERHEGESVVLPCVVEQKNPSPFGVYLKRGWLHPGEVLFMHTKSEFTPYNSDDTNRTSVSGDPSNHSVKVTLSLLRVSDTDRYYCEFVVNNPNSEDEHIRGMTEFFLLVKAGEECGCSGYSTLLFALFSAVVVFIVVLIGVMVIYKCKARRSVKSRPAAPIYEEMTGVQPLRCKLPPNHLEETESSEYRNCKVKKPYPENHYECPTGALRPRTESQK